MEFTVTNVGDVAVVEVHTEELDASNADDFRREMDPILHAQNRIVLDLNRVQFADSRGCGAILSCLKYLSGVSGDLKICRVNKPVLTVFELIRLHRICEILPEVDDAVKAFGKVKSK
ncbi:MAG TPA: STAS domain-containing protein [Gemmataceae bacterium]|jgi:anti-sigma B factor antagonist|nr:STAS domain-containing protein [Gemmataceae bacterium]